mmetsp:Transcript_24834/g.85045  ORF Transcript_24834/g.85045 Transcript_24834/m.85045 type:complete len:234 (+) Transcript_24834:300-1001(+)
MIRRPSPVATDPVALVARRFRQCDFGNAVSEEMPRRNPFAFSPSPQVAPPMRGNAPKRPFLLNGVSYVLPRFKNMLPQNRDRARFEPDVQRARTRPFGKKKSRSKEPFGKNKSLSKEERGPAATRSQTQKCEDSVFKSRGPPWHHFFVSKPPLRAFGETSRRCADGHVELRCVEARQTQVVPQLGAMRALLQQAAVVAQRELGLAGVEVVGGEAREAFNVRGVQGEHPSIRRR